MAALSANGLSNTGELGYDRLNGTRKIGPSYAKSVIYIWRILDMHWTGTKHIVRHMQKSVVQWSVISKFTCIRPGFHFFHKMALMLGDGTHGSEQGLQYRIHIPNYAFAYKISSSCPTVFGICEYKWVN